MLSPFSHPSTASAAAAGTAISKPVCSPTPASPSEPPPPYKLISCPIEEKYLHVLTRLRSRNGGLIGGERISKPGDAIIKEVIPDAKFGTTYLVETFVFRNLARLNIKELQDYYRECVN